MLRELIIRFRNDKKAIPILVALVIITQSITVFQQSWIPDKEPDYNIFIMPTVSQCDLTQYPRVGGATIINETHVIPNGIYSNSRDPLKWWINCLSFKEFHTPKLIPEIFNLGLMPLVYLLAFQITKDKLVALIAFVAFINNPLYSQWVTSGTYDQVWSFFLILSVYLLYRFKDLTTSTASFCCSIAAKGIGFLYLPSLIYTSLITKIPKDGRITLAVIVLIIVGGFVLIHFPHFVGAGVGFFPDHSRDAIWRNFEMLYPEIPFLVGFTLIANNFKPKTFKIPGKKLCVIWILNSLATTPIIFLFSNQFQFVYRFVPLAVFMSIFIGIVTIELFNVIKEYLMNRSNHK